MSDLEDDFEIEDILGNLNKKKERKKNTSKAKGNRGENQLCDVLEARFPGNTFFRVIGSGNRWSQVELTEATKSMFTGDIVCPPNFRFCLESKYGYEDIELWNMLQTGNNKIDEWLQKAQRDADYVNKEPMLCWRIPRKHHIAFLKYQPTHSIYMAYKEWIVISLANLFEYPDTFWFKTAEEISAKL